MKCTLVFLGLVALALAAPSDDKYTDKYDSVDLDEILSNDRLFNSYFKCLMEEGKCTADGKELKENLPDALQNDCSKCTEAQKNGTKKVMKHLVNKKPEEWKKLKAKYDPEGLYSKKHEDDLREATQ